MGDVLIGVVEKVRIDCDRRSLDLNVVMGIGSTPARVSSVEEADLTVWIPTTMEDPTPQVPGSSSKTNIPLAFGEPERIFSTSARSSGVARSSASRDRTHGVGERSTARFFCSTCPGQSVMTTRSVYSRAICTVASVDPESTTTMCWHHFTDSKQSRRLCSSFLVITVAVTGITKPPPRNEAANLC